MDDLLRRSLLYDFYGELLTAHQKDIYEKFIQEDLSLGEIAQDAGISRQGVHDLIKRCSRTLQGYEDTLHLVSRFVAVREKVKCINDILDREAKGPESVAELKGDIRRISNEILEEL